MLGLLGSLLAFVGAIWLVITAVQTGKDTTDKVIWGLVNFLCQPLGGIIFFIVKKQGLIPLLLVLAGMVLMFFGGAMNFTTSYNMP
jgi:peptidoglycan/LPS O-acetylase OafA/YrhL